MTKRLVTLCGVFGLCYSGLVSSYPVDGYPDTGIRRVEQVRLIAAGELKGTKQPPGALLTTPEVDIRLLGKPDMKLPAVDAQLTEQVVALLGDKADRYGMALLDLSDPDNPSYVEYRAVETQNVGSIGKILGALGYFQALADIYPGDVEKRASVLKNTVMTADKFAHTDHHTIRIFDVDTRVLTRRVMEDGDRGNVWEYLDWTLSVSSNSAAAMLMRDAMLLRNFGTQYPIAEAEILPFFANTPAADKTRLFQKTFWEPVSRNHMSLNEFRQGSFFTREGKRQVAGGGLSYGSARGLMKYLLLMEQGKLVDEWSSRSLKRLLYMTERRIRYASSPALRDSAVYFKSGSLYSCEAEEGFRCVKYKGNKKNFMNSIAIVETQIGDKKLHYIVTLISNVLKENSAVAHQTFGTQVHQLMKARHGISD
jgi:hypothetical protein